MDTQHQGASQAEASHRRSRKIKALLASGVVLGVGAVATLAAWNDSEFFTSDFAAGTFDLEGSVDGTAFTSHDASPGVTVEFAVNPGALTPGDTVYAPFAVQLSADSTYEANVVIGEEASGDIAAVLSYSVYVVDDFAECGASVDTTGDLLIDGRAASTAGYSSESFDLTAPETPVSLCFAVTASNALQQGDSGTLTWELRGTSTNPLD